MCPLWSTAIPKGNLNDNDVSIVVMVGAGPSEKLTVGTTIQITSIAKLMRMLFPIEYIPSLTYFSATFASRVAATPGISR